MHAWCAFSYIHYGQLIHGKAGQQHVQLTVVAAYTYIQSVTIDVLMHIDSQVTILVPVHSYIAISARASLKCMSNLKSYIKYHGASLSSFDTGPFLVRLDHFQLAKNGPPKPNFCPISVRPDHFYLDHFSVTDLINM